MTKKSITIVAVIILLFSNLSASKAEQKIELKFWFPYSGDSAKPLTDAIKRFESKHPNIVIKPSPNLTIEKTLAAINSKKGPDLSMDLGLDNINRFCESKTWMNLKPYLQSKNGFDINKIYVAPVAKQFSDNKMRCALPFMTDVYGLFSNTDILKESKVNSFPKTTSELYDVSKKVTRFSTTGDIAQAGYIPWTNYYAASWGGAIASYMFGAKWYDSNGKSAFANDSKWLEALMWQYELIKNIYGNGSYQKGSKNLQKFVLSAGDEWGCTHDLQSGRTSLLIDGDWRVGSFCPPDAKQKIANVNYSVSPIPISNLKSQNYGFGIIGGPVIGISNDTQHKSEAWLFLKFLTTDKQALLDSFASWFSLPTTNEAVSYIEKNNIDAHWQSLISMLKNPSSTWRGVSPIGNQDQDIVNKVFVKLQLGQISGSNANIVKSKLQAELKKAASEVDLAISRSK